MFLAINVERTRFAISAISEFKNLDKEQLLMNLEVRYNNESGIDGGNILKTSINIKKVVLEENFSHLLLKNCLILNLDYSDYLKTSVAFNLTLLPVSFQIIFYTLNSLESCLLK